MLIRPSQCNFEGREKVYVLFKVEQGRTGAGISTSTLVSILCYSLDPDSRKRVVLDIETFSRRLGKIL